jgi:hypothetical protein
MNRKRLAKLEEQYEEAMWLPVDVRGDIEDLVATTRKLVRILRTAVNETKGYQPWIEQASVVLNTWEEDEGSDILQLLQLLRSRQRRS